MQFDFAALHLTGAERQIDFYCYMHTKVNFLLHTAVKICMAKLYDKILTKWGGRGIFRL